MGGEVGHPHDLRYLEITLVLHPLCLDGKRDCPKFFLGEQFKHGYSCERPYVKFT
jgi:hypothetical protein